MIFRGGERVFRGQEDAKFTFSHFSVKPAFYLIHLKSTKMIELHKWYFVQLPKLSLKKYMNYQIQKEAKVVLVLLEDKY